MIDFLASLSSPYWSGFATAISLITAAFAVFGFIRRRRARIYYERQDYPILPSINIPGAEVSVSLNGTSSSALHLTTLFIVNRTNGGIDDSNFLGNPFVIESLGGIIFDCRQIRTPSTCEYRVEITQGGLEIKGIKCPKEAGLLIEIWHDGYLGNTVKSNTKGDLQTTSYTVGSSTVESIAYFALATLFMVSGASIATFGQAVFAEKDFRFLDLLWTLGPPLLLAFIVITSSSNRVSSVVRKILVRSEAEREYLNYRAQSRPPVSSSTQSR